MELDALRKKLDAIDEQMVDLFSARLDICKDIAAWKKENNRAIYDPEREREKMAAVVSMADEDKKKNVVALYSLLFDLSKAYQGRQIGNTQELGVRIQKALEETAKEFPAFPTVACQGTEGSNSQAACAKLFSAPNILYFKSFDAVFSAIEQGLCQYGVLPVENSTAGSLNQVYDLMMKHKFYIVRSTSCESIYRLQCLEENIQDQESNYTRFICISKDLEIYPGADRTSIMAVARHQPGALYKILSHFYALGMNLSKLESRPLPDRDFEFMFYFDLEKSVYAPEFTQMLDELGNICEHYEYLGSYSEVI